MVFTLDYLVGFLLPDTFPWNPPGQSQGCALDGIGGRLVADWLGGKHQREFGWKAWCEHHLRAVVGRENSRENSRENRGH